MTAQLPTTVDGVIDRLAALDAELDPRDGVACFNHIYLKVTKLVKAKVTDGTFKDGAFIEQMDVNFAGLFLKNVDSAKAGGRVDPAWQSIFDQRHNPVIWPIQFALAAMNAHIDHDLALAVVETCKQRRTSPDTPPVHEDFEKVNDLLADAEAEIRAEFELQLEKIATAPAESLKHYVSSFSMAAAREVAWSNATRLWKVRDDFLAYQYELAAITRPVGFANVAILTPVIPPPAD
ncbi:DUF5995 family protein [Kitasatospora sp. NPDC089509]|uniref:DUF5995 family protein n=1 Tax=Kitasatospora sp. NPDC089509 TaxID=3364079 RepID=UPI00381090E1